VLHELSTVCAEPFGSLIDLLTLRFRYLFLPALNSSRMVAITSSGKMCRVSFVGRGVVISVTAPLSQ
jgi:hypothetical protein